MRFITIKDPHIRHGFDHPRGRTQDFFTQIDAKLENLYQIAERRNIDTLVFTGDILDKSSGYTGLQLVSVYNKFKEIKQHFKNVYSILGNHDTLWASSAFKQQSPYQHLLNTGVIHDITEHPAQLGNYTLAGVDYANIEATIQALHKLDQKHQNLIAVLHTHLVPDSDTIPFGDFTTYSNITKGLQNTKMIVAGHLHKGYPTQQVNGITIINQWSFTRLARDYYAVTNTHIPQVVIVDTEDIHNPKTINLVYSPYSEAFIEKDLTAETQLLQNMQEFIESCKTINIKGNSTIENAPEDIRQRVQYYLNKAEEAHID